MVARLAARGAACRRGRSRSTASCARSARRGEACWSCSRTATRTGSTRAPARAIALPGLGLVWRAPGRAGHRRGGRRADPAGADAHRRRRPPSRRRRRRRRRSIRTRARRRSRCRWPPPPPMADSWQLHALRAARRPARAQRLRARRGRSLRRRARPAGRPLVVPSGPGLREVLVIDPRHGDPVRRVHAARVAPRRAFSTVVDGKPVAGRRARRSAARRAVLTGASLI